MTKKRSASLVASESPCKRQKTSNLSLLTTDPTGLAVFLKKIEEDEGDIVSEYLSESNGAELLVLLESGYDRKANELAVILRVIATIIVRTRTDLSELYGDTGRRLAEGVLEEAPLAACFRALKPQSSAEAAKASLQLLAAVVSTDPVLLGRSLLRSVNFDHPDWVQVSRRRNTKDPSDVRTCFVNFIASFLVSGNNLLIRELLESKNAIMLLISESFTDKLQNVLLILTLLRTSVCENPTVSKTIKMRIFNRATLKQLAYLYAYRGEALSAKAALARSDADIDAQAVEMVRDTLHKLLHPLTSSPLFGIVFRERASVEGSFVQVAKRRFSAWNYHYLPFHSKQNEHLLSLLLSPPMENAFTDDLRRELASDCLLACPALLPAYLAHWAPSMVPRDSDNWHDLMGFVNQVSDASFFINQVHAHRVWVFVESYCSFTRSQVLIATFGVDFFVAAARTLSSTNMSKAYFSLQLFTLFQKRLVSRASQLLELSQDMGQFVQGISDVCLPPACIVEPLRVASQHESSAVVKTSAAIHKTLRKNLSLLLTWLSTTDELKAKGATAEAVVSAILKLLPERVLAEKWFHRFSKTLKKEHTDVQVLNDQVLMHAEADDEPEEQPEESDKRDEPPSPEEELAALPKSMLSSVRCCTCGYRGFRNYWQKATVYDCIAAGVRLFSRADAKVGWGRTEKSHKDGSLSPSPKKLIKLISKNPVFRSILFEKVLGRPAEELSSLSLSRTKAGLVNLLLALVEAEPIVAAKKIPLVALLAAYRGSLSLCDRLLLQLIYLLDINGTTVSSIWGMSSKAVVWGDRLFDHYRFATTLSEIPTLWREPNPGAFLSMLDKDRVLRTAVAFPVTRRCLARSSMGVENIPLDADLYDPCFLLPLFLQYLSPGDANEQMNPEKLDLRGFYTRNCLSLAIGALSSYSRHIRGLAKSVIARFRQLSDAWKPTKVPNTPMALAVMKQFPERLQLNFILDTLRNSLSTKASELGGGPRCVVLFGSKADTSFRLTRIHANFFIQSLEMLTKPEHRMYEVFWNTYLAKPSIDLGTVPDFIRIMFSVHEDFRVERQWMVKLCADSVNDTSDYLLLEKSRVYKYCLLLYADPATDTTTQIQILRLFAATTRLPRACHALTRFHAFPLWLFRHALSTTHAPSLCYFLTIISQMLAAFEDAKENSPCLTMLRLLDVTFRKIHDESSFSKRKIKPMLS
ncbi:unnamed protein product [Mesocestoides corti]|uniref:Nucleolar pre-ribosomal-associated protein 1 N-terminal domain-containing protein n=1 Tax=Mesocestoides corti TaxID=53468 RepID=A0A0R3U680_MESCO|nr:unnamed protein product [Mesocestoides corti]